MRPKLINSIAVVLVVGFAIAAVFLTRPQAAPSVSGISGLVALKSMASTSMPYETAMASHNPTVVEFYADWCTSCQALSPTLQALHEEWGDRTNFVMLNIDDPQWAKQVKQFQVNGIPHVALLSADHQLTDTFIGNTPKAMLNEHIAKLF